MNDATVVVPMTAALLIGEHFDGTIFLHFWNDDGEYGVTISTLGSGDESHRPSSLQEVPGRTEYLLGYCYADHDPPRPAIELLRLHVSGQQSREVAACEKCAAILRIMAL